MNRRGHRIWRRLKQAGSWLTTLYVILLCCWFALHSLTGDRFWWMALINSFVPWLFAPLVCLLPLALILRTRRAVGHTLVPAILFAILYGTLFLPARQPAVSPEQPVTIMSFNVWGFSRDAATARVIQDNGSPDIVVVQELSPEMAQMLIEQVGSSYPYRLLRPVAGVSGMGILSRYPLREQAGPTLGEGVGFLLTAEVIVGDRTITIYNCHPLATNPLAYVKRNRPVGAEVARSFALRRDFMASVIADARTRSTPVIIAGDFNATDQSDTYRMLAAQFSDAHRAAGWGFGHTFPAYRGHFLRIPILPRLLRIDMIWSSAEFVPLASHVGGTFGESDHLPTVARLGWRR